MLIKDVFNLWWKKNLYNDKNTNNYIITTYIHSCRFGLKILSTGVNDPHTELANWNFILMQQSETDRAAKL
jgi:hypothetical protein